MGSNMTFCHRPYSSNRFNLQFTISMFLALCIATFINHILNIFFISTKEQMIGIYAGWIVTFMADEKTVWNWSLFKKPDCARNRYRVLFFIDPNITIAMTTMTMPNPASRFVNCYFTFENSVFERRSKHRSTIDSAMPRTKWIPSPLTAGLSLERYSTITTIENHSNYYSTK